MPRPLIEDGRTARMLQKKLGWRTLLYTCLHAQHRSSGNHMAEQQFPVLFKPTHVFHGPSTPRPRRIPMYCI